MKMNKKATAAGFTFWSFFAIIAIIGIVLVGSFAIKWGVNQVKDFSLNQKVILDVPITIPTWLGGEYIGELFTDGETLTVQLLLLGLIVSFMLAVAFIDILTSFSSFRQATANYLGIGLALIAVLTGAVRGVIVWFGFTAGIGAVSIGVVMIGAFVIFAAVNLLIGKKALSALRNAKDMDDVAKNANATKLAFAKARATVGAINTGNQQGKNMTP